MGGYMKISKLFLKDILTKRKIKQYIVVIIAFFISINLFFKEIIGTIFNDRYLSLLTVIIIFTSTAYIIYTYSLFEKIKQYIMLPIKSFRFIMNFAKSLFICALLERISFLLIGIILFSDSPLLASTTVLIYATLSILLNIWILLILNSNRKKDWISLTGVIILLLSIFLTYLTKIVEIAGIFLCLIITINGISNHISIELAIHRKRKSNTKKSNIITNYFFRVLITEKIYIINTLMICLMLIFLTVMNIDNFIVLNLTWTVGAMNTPVLTMLSSDPYLRKQAELLPNKGKNILGMYKYFLLYYFIITNSIIFILIQFTTGRDVILYAVLFIVLSVLETTVSYNLEQKMPLKTWQTKQELWKHPRKYILPIIVFLFTSLLSMLAY